MDYYLVLLAPPKFVEEIVDTKVTLGTTLKLKAAVDGYPKPAIKWTKDKQAMSAPIFEFDDEDPLNLTVKEVSASISGCYSISAKNLGGDAKTTCMVKVQGTCFSNLRKPYGIQCHQSKDWQAIFQSWDK